MSIERIAIISDLHVGNKSRAKDLNPKSTEDGHVHNFLELFEEFVSANRLKADFLLIPGDITDKSEPDESQYASDAIIRIAKLLSVKIENVIFTLGNHDKSWKEIERSQEDNLNQIKTIRKSYANILDEELIFKKRVDQGQGRFDKSPFYVTWTYDSCFFLSINTSATLLPEDKVKYGLISTEQLNRIEDHLQSLNLDSKLLKIAIIHHHPISYHDANFTQVDLSALQNSEGLLRILSNHGFDTMIHGHRHIPRFTPMTISKSHPILLVGAGSFSARLDERWFGPIGNSFHLLELEKTKGDKSNYSQGCFYSWSFSTGHDWKPSDSGVNGINHKSYYGNWETQKNLKNIIRSLLSQRFSKENFIRWKDIISEDTQLAYIPPETLKLIFEELTGELDFTIMEPTLTKSKDVRESILLRIEDETKQ